VTQNHRVLAVAAAWNDRLTRETGRKPVKAARPHVDSLQAPARSPDPGPLLMRSQGGPIPMAALVQIAHLFCIRVEFSLAQYDRTIQSGFLWCHRPPVGVL